MRAVVATGKTSGWAFPGGSTVAYERTGATTWKKVAFPGQGGAVNVAEASSPSDVWAAHLAASGQQTQLDHWNGHRWTVARTFPGMVTSLSVLGPDDVWAFGGLTSKSSGNPQGVFHFNGRYWVQVATTPQGGSAVSDRNIWEFAGPVITHFNGRKWTRANVARLIPPTPKGRTGGPRVTGIIEIAPDNVYATGEGVPSARVASGVLLHFDGRTWTTVARGINSFSDQQLVSDGRGGVWFAASDAVGLFTSIYHYSAGTLTRASLPTPKNFVDSGDSVSRIPGTADVLVGGAEFNPSYPAGNRSVVFQSA